MGIKPYSIFKRKAGPSFCPHCRQPLGEVRLGVRFPALKVRMFDLIEGAGADGIDTLDLIDIAFDGQSTIQNIHNHVKQMNDMLNGTEWRISGANPRGQYRLVRRNYGQGPEGPGHGRSIRRTQGARSQGCP
jgi:hypothetical protein